MRRNIVLACLLAAGLSAPALADDAKPDTTPQALIPMLTTWWKTLKELYEEPHDMSPLRSFAAGASPLSVPEGDGKTPTLERIFGDRFDILGLDTNDQEIKPPLRAPWSRDSRSRGRNR